MAVSGGGDRPVFSSGCGLVNERAHADRVSPLSTGGGALDIEVLLHLGFCFIQTVAASMPAAITRAALKDAGISCSMSRRRAPL